MPGSPARSATTICCRDSISVRFSARVRGALAPAAITAAFLWLALAEFRLVRHAGMLRPALYGLALAAVQT